MTNIGRYFAVAVAAAFFTGWMPSAGAVEVPTLFTAEVPLDENAGDSREKAYRAALVEVLARVSGSELSRNGSAIDELFPQPGAYVTQFRPGGEGTLFVSFDGAAVEQKLRSSGVTVWGSNRPLTLVWLAVDWGQGVREIIAAEDPDQIERQSRSIDRNRLLRERLLDIAQRRGVPILFPLLDTTDLQSVAFSDIWGGFDERIIEASERYDVNSVLIGRVRAASAQRNRWTYSFGGESRSWSGTPEHVVAQIADLLAAEFAVGGNEPLQRVALRISGIESVDAYGAVQKMLGDVAMIESIHIDEVAGDAINYEVEVRGGSRRLRRALNFAGLVEQEADNGLGASESELEFFYNP